MVFRKVDVPKHFLESFVNNLGGASFNGKEQRLKHLFLTVD